MISKVFVLATRANGREKLVEFKTPKTLIGAAAQWVAENKLIIPSSDFVIKTEQVKEWTDSYEAMVPVGATKTDIEPDTLFRTFATDVARAARVAGLFLELNNAKEDAARIELNLSLEQREVGPKSWGRARMRALAGIGGPARPAHTSCFRLRFGCVQLLGQCPAAYSAAAHASA
jgi:hypothetical protein